MKALIIPYDFEILLDEYLTDLGIDPKKTDSGYDHNINFSGVEGFDEFLNCQEKISLQISAIELAHILLSDLYRFRTFVDKYDAENPFQNLIDQLKTIREQFSVSADIYYSKYHFPSGKNQFGKSSFSKSCLLFQILEYIKSVSGIDDFQTGITGQTSQF